jgi:hypothetical protein
VGLKRERVKMSLQKYGKSFGRSDFPGLTGVSGARVSAGYSRVGGDRLQKVDRPGSDAGSLPDMSERSEVENVRQGMTRSEEREEKNEA